MAAATTSADTWSGEIVLATGLAVYLGPGAAAARHRHDAIQIIISPNRPVDLGTDPGTVRAPAAIVASRESHDFDAHGAVIAVMLVEPSGRLGRRLNAVAQRSPDLTGLDVDVRLPSNSHPTVVVDWARSFVTPIVGDTAAARADGARAEVREARRFIDAHLHGAPQLADIANHVGYSPRQLRRHFADEIGMPYRRYVLWRRLRHALLAVRDGDDLTIAAAAAGFADSAHLSRTFRQTFGLTPSEVLPLLTVADTEH